MTTKRPPDTLLFKHSEKLKNIQCSCHNYDQSLTVSAIKFRFQPTFLCLDFPYDCFAELSFIWLDLAIVGPGQTGQPREISLLPTISFFQSLPLPPSIIIVATEHLGVGWRLHTPWRLDFPDRHDMAIGLVRAWKSFVRAMDQNHVLPARFCEVGGFCTFDLSALGAPNATAYHFPDRTYEIDDFEDFLPTANCVGMDDADN